MGITQVEYSNLDQVFNYLNRMLFGGELPDVLFTYQYRGKYHGFYHPKRFAIRGNKSRYRIAEIALNPKVFVRCNDIEIIQTVAHEMVHHWQHTRDQPSRGGYHNKRFASKMEEIGLMPSHTGKPGGKKTGPNMGDYPIPNGRFERAAKQLIKGGFSAKFEAPFTASDIRSVQPSPTQADPTASTPLQCMEEDATPPHPNAKATFVCPCEDMMWGKPSLQAICKKCGGEFARARKGCSSPSQKN